MHPGSGLHAELFLADAANVADGKLYVLGGGWSITQYVPGPVPIAIGGTIRIPWDETNTPHQIKISLRTSNGEPVVVQTPLGDQPYQILGNFEAGRPPGIPKGTEFVSPFALTLIRPPLVPGRYEFLVEIVDKQTHLVFDVTSPG